MPYISKEQRAAGGWAADVEDPHHGAPCDHDWTKPQDAATLRHRPMAYPDQSRYGPTGTTDAPRYWADGCTLRPREIDNTGGSGK